MKIDFLVPGINKCGTTTLCHLLAQHPAIFFPRLKEPHYFDRPVLEEHIARYERLFRGAKPSQLRGEGTQTYSSVEHGERVSERLHHHNPQMRLIFSVRNPLQRIESSYREFHHSGSAYGVLAPFGLDAAIEALPWLLEDSRYWTRLRCFRERFPDQQIAFVFLEDLQRAPEAELTRCFDFLGVDASFTSPAVRAQLNSRDKKHYDTPLLRILRTNPMTAHRLAKLPVKKQDRVLGPMGLRRRFGDAPLSWTPQARARAVSALKPDIQLFLRHCGKPADYWPEFA